jgi:hypothetical protein
VYKDRPASIDAEKVRAPKAHGVGATYIAKKLGIGQAICAAVIVTAPALFDEATLQGPNTSRPIGSGTA